MRKLLLILLILAICFFSIDFALAVAVKVRPAQMQMEARPGILAKKEITVENPGNNVALFEVYADDFSERIKLRPESFTLQPGEQQKVVLEVKSQETGIFSTMVSVLAKPLSGRKFRANSGVKIPLQVRISEKKTNMFLASLYPFRFSIHLASAVIILLLILGMLKCRQRPRFFYKRA